MISHHILLLWIFYFINTDASTSSALDMTTSDQYIQMSYIPTSSLFTQFRVNSKVLCAAQCARLFPTCNIAVFDYSVNSQCSLYTELLTFANLFPSTSAVVFSLGRNDTNEGTTSSNILQTTATTTTTTTQDPLVSLTNSGDITTSLYSTQAGGSTGGVNCCYGGSGPEAAIDNDITTKYLNLGPANCESCSTATAGVDTGFFVIPAISNVTIARGLLFATAEDHPDRDPITVTLEGSNYTNITMLHQGSSWTLLYNGSTGISGTIDPGRNVYTSQQNFSNTTPYASYRLLITSKRSTENSVQYAESHIIGYA